MGLILSISVGPIIFAIIRQSVINGHKNGLFFVLGVSASDVTVVVICNFFSTLFESAMAHEKVIGVVGSIFLFAIGIYNLFFKKAITAAEMTKVENKQTSSALLSSFFSGYLMNILNPGVFIFWFAASATLLTTSQSSDHPLRYRLTAFAVCLVFVLAFDILKVFLSGKIRNRLTPHNVHLINRLSGLIMIVFAIVLVIGVFSGKLPTH
ncbi:MULTISPECIES: LysE family translocator [Chitinophagaceae]